MREYCLPGSSCQAKATSWKCPHSSKQETPQTPQRYFDLPGTRNTSASTTGTSEFHDANATWVQVVMTLKEPHVNEMVAI